MNIVEIAFKEIAVIRNEIVLYSKNDTLLFIEACENNNIKILGIDGFYLFDEKIQPSSENSIDFSSAYYILQSNSLYTDAIEFLRLKDDTLFFEIICSQKK